MLLHEQWLNELLVVVSLSCTDSLECMRLSRDCGLHADICCMLCQICEIVLLHSWLHGRLFAVVQWLVLYVTQQLPSCLSVMQRFEQPKQTEDKFIP